MAEEKEKEQTGKEKKESIELIALKSVAIPLDLDTFVLALKNGGKLVFKNQYQKHENGPYFHALKYKSDWYITKTDNYIKDFFV